jgi:hypothetical protein
MSAPSKADISRTSAHNSDTAKCNAAVQAALGTAAAFLAGIVIAATPATTQPSPIHAVGDRLSPRNYISGSATVILKNDTLFTPRSIRGTSLPRQPTEPTSNSSPS